MSIQTIVDGMLKPEGENHRHEHLGFDGKPLY